MGVNLTVATPQNSWVKLQNNVFSVLGHSVLEQMPSSRATFTLRCRTAKTNFGAEIGRFLPFFANFGAFFKQLWGILGHFFAQFPDFSDGKTKPPAAMTQRADGFKISGRNSQFHRCGIEVLAQHNLIVSNKQKSIKSDLLNEGVCYGKSA